MRPLRLNHVISCESCYGDMIDAKGPAGHCSAGAGWRVVVSKALGRSCPLPTGRPPLFRFDPGTPPKRSAFARLPWRTLFFPDFRRAGPSIRLAVQRRSVPAPPPVETRPWRWRIDGLKVYRQVSAWRCVHRRERGEIPLIRLAARRKAMPRIFLHCSIKGRSHR